MSLVQRGLLEKGVTEIVFIVTGDPYIHVVTKKRGKRRPLQKSDLKGTSLDAVSGFILIASTCNSYRICLEKGVSQIFSFFGSGLGLAGQSYSWRSDETHCR